MSEVSRSQRPVLRVRDIMRREVFSVPPDLPLREAARRLWDRGISGAAVVDESGRVLGVISTTDLLRLEAYGLEAPEPERFPSPGERVRALKEGGLAPDAAAPGGSAAAPSPGEGRAVEPEPEEGRTVEPALEQYVVRDVMMPIKLSIHESATIPELARFLLRAGIHRALVMDGPRLVGIVTTSDVLRAVAGGEALHW